MTWTCPICPRTFPSRRGLVNHTRGHATQPDTKWCGGCNQALPLDQFGRCGTNSSGIQHRCRPCTNVVTAAKRAAGGPRIGQPLVPKALPPAAWKLDASCRGADVNLFFSLPTDAAAIAQAKAICRDCPCQAPCLEEALATSQQGLWGGTTDQERLRLSRARKRQKAST